MGQSEGAGHHHRPLLAATATAYSYAGDDPVNNTDPTGQAIQHDTTSGSTALQAAQITCDLDKQRAEQAHKHHGWGWNPS